MIDTILDALHNFSYLSYVFLFFAGICNGIMDSLQFHYKNSLLDKLDGDRDTFDPDKSWINKHKDYGNSIVANSFEHLRKTALVFTTDLWHLAQWFMITFFILAITFNDPSEYTTIEFLIMRFGTFHIGFALMYYYVLKQKK